MTDYLTFSDGASKREVASCALGKVCAIIIVVMNRHGGLFLVKGIMNMLGGSGETCG